MTGTPNWTATAVDSSGDVVIEHASQGNDTVIASINYVLGGDLENLTLLAGSSATSATGNSVNNVIVGNANGNVLHGGGGGDEAFYGGAGNETNYLDSKAMRCSRTRTRGSIRSLPGQLYHCR